MSAYLLLPLFACVATSVLATAILSRDSKSGASRLSAALLYGGAFWAFCEVLWTTASDPVVALRLVKLSAIGWAMAGPLGLHLLIEVIGEPAHALRQKLPKLYAASVAFLVLDWATPWIHPGVVETPWGFSYELGPAYPLYWVFTASALIWGLGLCARAYRRLPSSAERKQAGSICAGFLVLLVVASITDGILPLLQIQVVRLGTPTFVLLAATLAFSLHRYRHALLVPAAYSGEIVETMREGLCMLRLDGRIRTANTAMARLAGCSRQALMGVRLHDLIGCDPLDALSAEAGLECELRPLSGATFSIAISTSILRNGQGEPSGAAVVVRDQREVTNLRERLLLSGRMAAVGQLAAGVAHEINNPIAYVRANLVSLRQYWDSLRELTAQDPTACEKHRDEIETMWHEGAELIDESLEGVARTSAIVTSIREFSHAGSAVREAVDLNEVVAAAHRMAVPRFSSGTDVQLDYGELPSTVCSSREIQQVVLNLLINAADAVDEDGTIRIVTRREGEWVRLSVSDNGGGIDEESLECVFDPFYTTKGVGEGTGLGLSISYEIIARHAGQIDVDSTLGKGTTFHVRLPISLPQA